MNSVLVFYKFFVCFLLSDEKQLQNDQIIYMTFASKLIHAVEYTRL